jgi:transketolase|tara:strand:+ start:464 stop:946 length:483 start_codon:yes stop_codon:yes gene_type:complete
MRKSFAKLLYNEMLNNQDIVLVTGDLGYGLWDDIRRDFPTRFHNVGSAEQLMMGVAVGMAMEGKIPVVYSITSFLLYRPFELIRNYLDHENVPVKLVGGGRDRDYGYLGFSHWAEDDKEIMGCFKNINVHHPENQEELEEDFKNLISSNEPHYINLKRKY